MVKDSGGLRLALEAVQRLAIVGYVMRKKFKSDEAAESDVLGLVDQSQPAATGFLHDAVVRDGLVEMVENLTSAKQANQ